MGRRKCCCCDCPTRLDSIVDAVILDITYTGDCTLSWLFEPFTPDVPNIAGEGWIWAIDIKEFVEYQVVVSCDGADWHVDVLVVNSAGPVTYTEGDATIPCADLSVVDGYLTGTAVVTITDLIDAPFGVCEVTITFGEPP